MSLSTPCLRSEWISVVPGMYVFFFCLFINKDDLINSYTISDWPKQQNNVGYYYW